jgi:methyl-accepting chemotaxis protein
MPFGSLFKSAGASAVLSAFSKSQAIIEFDLDGVILSANENFLKTVGYTLSEIKGKHHSIFVDPAFAGSRDYADFWAKLKAGDFESGQYKRYTKDRREIWIAATYSPVFSGSKPYKIVKIATDITVPKLRAADERGKLEAISRAQAIIEFTPHGEILTANQNFLSALGYELPEIVGRHHSMFCEPDYARSDAYRQFWAALAAGEFQTGEFHRTGKDGRKIWIQASYNPIFDMNGKVFKVVKFATDVSARVHAVEALANGLTALSQGNLNQNITTSFPVNLERLRSDFNESLGRLREAMVKVGANADVIAAQTREFRSATDDLSRRTAQQASSVEETAGALAQVTNTVADSTRSAEQAGQLVATTRQDAERSGEVVKRAISAMSAIEGSSKEISNIIGVIDDIAFQTNLLALNAGVEAARAGDAGKGFAVVAQEVRELAQRSANAAKEIKALINTSSDQVRQGVKLVGETGEALTGIVAQVENINLNVTAIVESSREQAIGLKEINQAVISMDQGTQQNAAMVEQSTAASHNLATEVEALNRLLATFDTGVAAGGKVANRHDARPIASPVRRAQQTIAKAFVSQGNAAIAQSKDTWEEF